MLRSRRWGVRSSLPPSLPPRRGGHCAGLGAGESLQVPAVPMRRQLSRIDLSRFLMKATGACQLSLSTEGGLWRGASLCWKWREWRMQLPESVWPDGAQIRSYGELDPAVYLLQGFPGFSLLTGCCSCSFPIYLPCSLCAICGLCRPWNTQAGHITALLKPSLGTRA